MSAAGEVEDHFKALHDKKVKVKEEAADGEEEQNLAVNARLKRLYDVWFSDFTEEELTLPNPRIDDKQTIEEVLKEEIKAGKDDTAEGSRVRPTTIRRLRRLHQVDGRPEGILKVTDKREQVDQEMVASLADMNTGAYKDRSHVRLELWFESISEVNRREFVNLCVNILYFRALTNRKSTEPVMVHFRAFHKLGCASSFPAEFACMKPILDEALAASFLDYMDDGKTPATFVEDHEELIAALYPVAPFKTLLAVKKNEWGKYTAEVCIMTESKLGSKMFGWAVPIVARGAHSRFCIPVPCGERPLSNDAGLHEREVPGCEG